MVTFLMLEHTGEGVEGEESLLLDEARRRHMLIRGGRHDPPPPSAPESTLFYPIKYLHIFSRICVKMEVIHHARF